MGRSLEQPMLMFLLAVLAVAYAITAAAIWHTYRRNYRADLPSPDSQSDDA